MKEKDFISIIKNKLNSDYIGDDCAFLKDLNITITQDSLVEDVHFSMKYFTPYELGYKSVAVNLSDIAASGAEPKYLTISLSLPNKTDDNFIKEFYDGCISATNGKAEIVGGDITSSDKIYISVCAIGSTLNRNISSRKNAKIGYKVVVCANHGSSDIGLKLLQKNAATKSNITKAHLMPQAQIEFCKHIAQNLNSNIPYAMMDTSDGLIDALSTIANESKVLLKIDYDKIPHDKAIEEFDNWENSMLFGGEDYGIVAVVPKDFECGGVTVGEVCDGLGVNLIKNNNTIHYTKEDVESNIFNHFGVNND